MYDKEEEARRILHKIDLLERVGFRQIHDNRFVFNDETDDTFLANYTDSDDRLLTLALLYVFNQGIRVGKQRKCEEIKDILNINGD